MTQTHPKKYPEHFVRYLGTAGTRFVMLSQERTSGGIWFSYGGVIGVIDPGPGSLVQICKAVPTLNAMDIKALLLTHRHIDHSTDMNVLCEAMTNAGRSIQGCALVPLDARKTSNPVLYRYISKMIQCYTTIKDGKSISIGKQVNVEPVLHLHHGVDCFGFIFRSPGLPTWGVISDTFPLPHLPDRYRECDMISVNSTMPLPRDRLQHFSVSDVESLLGIITPKLLVLTHLGHGILNLGAETIAQKLSTPQTRAIAATDGMVIDLKNLSFSPKYPE